MSGTRERFRELNEAKANFDRIYVAPDPREYFRVLQEGFSADC